MSGLVHWFRAHINVIAPFLGAVAMGVKPLFVAGGVGPKEILSVSMLVAASYLAWLAPNLEGQGAKYVKESVVVVLAGLSAAQNVIPGGVSRADIWTIATAAVVAASPFLFPTTARRAVLASGAGQMGDGHPLDQA